MFELFKKRKFGDYVSDTFHFFNTNGKHYFKSYFTICGAFLLILLLFSYFFFKVYFSFFLKFDQDSNNENLLMNFISNNGIWLSLGVLIALPIMFLLYLLNYSIPVIYLELYATNHGKNFETKDILKQFKSNFSRIFVFSLGIFFVVTPLLVAILATITYFLTESIGVPVTILVGLPILFFLIPTLFCWITLSFLEFLNNRKGFLSSLGSGLKHLGNQYFPIVGSAMIIYFIINVAMGIFTMIPYIIGMVTVFTSTSNSREDQFSSLGIIMTIVTAFSILSGFILNNLLVINQGLVFYSRKEYDENVSSQDSIDLIGSE